MRGFCTRSSSSCIRSTRICRQLLADTLADSRWDFTYLGMQVLVEGVALAAFGLIRDQATNPLAQSVNAT